MTLGIVHIFPPNGLDRSLHAPILVGLLFVTFFTEAFGWTYAGLVVPGYLAALAAAAPLTCGFIVGEAIVTYLIVAAVGKWVPHTGAWSTAFGRERFFLFIVVAVLVRGLAEGFIVPFALTRWSLAHSRELYSVGLVLVPLCANVFWNSGIRSALPRLGVISALTYLVVRYVLLAHTNFSLSRLLIENESGAASFLVSPKAQIILLIGAMLGARGNVLYGWDYNGILVPALLGVAWYEPTKLAATFAEAIVIYGASLALTSVPPLSRALVVGTRRMLIAYGCGFALKMALGFFCARFFPRLQIVDYLGFGYVLPALLAVKMWNKSHVGIVLMPTLQVSLMAFLGGNVVAYALSLLGPPATAEPTAVDIREDSRMAGVVLSLADAAPRLIDTPRFDERRRATLRNLTDAIEAARDTGLVDERRLAALDGMDTVIAKGKKHAWLVLAPRVDDPDQENYAPRMALRRTKWPTHPRVVTIKPPAVGSSLYTAAVAVAEAVDAVAVVVLSSDPAIVPLDRDWVLPRVTSALDAGTVVAVEEAPPGTPTTLSVAGSVPAGLDITAVSQLLEERVPIAWRASRNDDELTANAPRFQLPRASSDSVAMRQIGADVEPLDWSGNVEDVLTSRLVELSTVGERGYQPPSVGELRVFDGTVARALVRGVGVDGPDAWTKTIAAQFGYRFARLSDAGVTKAWALFEAASASRRGNATWIGRAAAAAAARSATDMAILVPAPRWEVGTLGAAMALFSSSQASTLLLAGAMPHTAVSGAADVRRTSGRRSYYQRMHEAWLASGASALAVGGIIAERAPENEDAVISFGHELSSLSVAPAWSQPVWRSLTASGLRLGVFDGSGPHTPFGGAGDPTMDFADRFARDRYALIWLHPALRARLVTAATARERGRVFARSHHLPTNDVVQRTLDLRACIRRGTAGAASTAAADAASGCPAIDERCDLDVATTRWETYAREQNPYEWNDLARGGQGVAGCHVEVALDAPHGGVWAVIASRREVRLVPTAVPASTRTTILTDAKGISDAVTWGVMTVVVGGVP